MILNSLTSKAVYELIYLTYFPLGSVPSLQMESHPTDRKGLCD